MRLQYMVIAVMWSTKLVKLEVTRQYRQIVDRGSMRYCASDRSSSRTFPCAVRGIDLKLRKSPIILHLTSLFNLKETRARLEQSDGCSVS
jgi:hypothetical protein